MKHFLHLFLLFTLLQTQAQRLNVVLQLGHQDDIKHILVSEKEDFILTGSRDRSVILWETETQSQVHTFSGHDGTVTTLCFGKDENTFFAGTTNGTVYHWETNTGKLIKKWQATDERILSIAYASKANLMAIGGYSWKAQIWSLDSMKVIHEFEVDSDRGTGGGVNLSISPDEKYLAIGEDDKKVVLMDLKSYKKLHTQRLEKTGSCGGCPTKVQFINNQTIYAVTDNGPLARLKINTTKDSTYLSIEKVLNENVEDLLNLHVSKHEEIVVASEKEYLYYKNDQEKPKPMVLDWVTQAVNFNKGILVSTGKELVYTVDQHS